MHSSSIQPQIYKKYSESANPINGSQRSQWRTRREVAFLTAMSGVTLIGQIKSLMVNAHSIKGFFELSGIDINSTLNVKLVKEFFGLATDAASRYLIF